ncbi:MAG TPA: efflux RND transporter periplasmic adaptor subunit [Balneolaceae bacterium]|nr:efflux RND transporter periplasmic adaptor subunit [Balneolaceae bacterium]
MSTQESENTERASSQEAQSQDQTVSQNIEETLGITTKGMLKRHKTMIISAIILVAVAIAFVIWRSSRKPGAPEYTTGNVERGNLVMKVSATGNLQPLNTVDVGSEISGLIRSVNVDYNDHVKAGEVLAKLDTDRLQAEVSQARASLAASQASLEQAQATLNEQQAQTARDETLASQNFISRQSLENSRAALQRAKAAVSSAKAQVTVNRASLNVAETNLKKASILSPINGVVLVRNIRPGQAVAASFQTPVLFTLAEDLTRMELQADVDEADISQVKKGEHATFTVDAYPDTTFPATITKVYYAPQTVEDVVTYTAILSVNNSGLLLRPGMTATTDIITKQINNALMVPNSALRFTPPGKTPQKGQGPTVWIMKNNQPEAVSVKTGASNDEMTQILSGNLQPGQKVLTNVQRRKK